MLQDMDQSEFGKFVSALWAEQGWQTQVKRDDGRTFVAVQRPATGEEGLVWAIPDGEVGGQQVQQFVELCREYEVEESAIVTAGSVSDHARKAGKGTGVELLDGDQLADVLRRNELTELAERYGGDGGGADGDDDSPLDALNLDALGDLGERVNGLLGGALGDLPVSGKPVVAVVVVVALLGAGVLVGPSLPFLGGGGGPVSAESVSPANSTTTLRVGWNAAVTDSIDPNLSDGVAYPAPRGEQFVFVRLDVNNTGDGTVPVSPAAFRLRTDERTYRYQPLADHTGFVGFSIGPGQRYPGWMVFSVPKGTTGTLVYHQNATAAPVAVEFERDRSLSTNATRR